MGHSLLDHMLQSGSRLRVSLQKCLTPQQGPGKWLGTVGGKTAVIARGLCGLGHRGWGIVLAFPSILLILLCCLTIVRDIVSPVEHGSLAKLLAPTIAWTIIFLLATLRILYLIWIGRLEHSAWAGLRPRISRDEAVVVICFSLTHVLSAAVNDFGGTLLPRILLPAALSMLKILLPTLDMPSRRNLFLIVLATLLSSNCAVLLYQPSIVTVILGVCTSIFVSQAFLVCEAISDNEGRGVAYMELAPSEGSKTSEGNVVLESETPGKALVFRLRNISFFLAIFSTVSLLTLSRLDLFPSLSGDWWKREAGGVFIIETIRWIIIPFLLLERKCGPLAVATTLTISALLQFVYYGRHRYGLIGESLLSLMLFSSTLVSFSDPRAFLRELQLHRSNFKYLLAIIVTVIISLSVLHSRHIPKPKIEPPLALDAHPIEGLIRDAQIRFSETISKQSRTLAEAVQEYKRRYHMHPPPNFDSWYSFAQSNNVQMVDEYDTIQHLLRPFWGLPPSIIRQSAQDAFGAEGSHLMRVAIRKGQVTSLDGEWRTDAIRGMIRKFAHHLPDMDIMFNVHDEPSLVVPHDILNKLVTTAERHQAISLQHDPPHDFFSPRPVDLADEIPPHYGTRVLRISRQNIWSQSTTSCPLDSPARDINGGTDDSTSYATGPMGFIYNTTAFSEVCNQPSLPFRHGFFDRPNSLQYASNLIPVFSVAKVSTFNDILIPSPWHYIGRTPIDDSKDMEWEKKITQMHWRGSTTTGFPANGGWRRHHRQRFVLAMDNISHPVPVLKKTSNGGNNWIQDFLPAAEAQELFDVKFSSVSDSSASEDYEAQLEAFDIAPMEDQQDLWKWKYLLDIDGHGLSGRFYPMMKSKSLVFKCAMFREWHDEWLWPWVHYVPLGLEGSDWFEAVRYFALDEAGRGEGRRIATEGREWARKVLRTEDMEAWVFRLLLEYGRMAGSY